VLLARVSVTSTRNAAPFFAVTTTFADIRATRRNLVRAQLVSGIFTRAV
jgi:hypothetical protein